MISAIRITFFIGLFGGCLFLVASVLSYFFEVPGLYIDGEKVETTEQKNEILIFSLALLLSSSIVILLTSKSFLNRFPNVVKYYDWIETKPIYETKVQIIILVLIFILSMIASLVQGLADMVIVNILTMAITFIMTFVGMLLVLGVQVINPLCPEKILRWFTLFFLGAIVITSIIYIPVLLFTKISDPAEIVAPFGILGGAGGAIIILRKWTNFQPLTKSLIK